MSAQGEGRGGGIYGMVMNKQAREKMILYYHEEREWNDRDRC